MFSRRDLLLGAPVAARLGQQRPASPPPNMDVSSQELREIRDAVRDLHHLSSSDEVTLIRQKQGSHFKINQKFPNYIDVGLSVWERLSTWHLENHLPLTTRRTPEGRMEMDFMYTTLILKWEMADALIGVPYD